MYSIKEIVEDLSKLNMIGEQNLSVVIEELKEFLLEINELLDDMELRPGSYAVKLGYHRFLKAKKEIRLCKEEVVKHITVCFLFGYYKEYTTIFHLLVEFEVISAGSDITKYTEELVSLVKKLTNQLPPSEEV